MSRSCAAAAALLSCSLALALPARAEPYRPAHDSEVIEVLPRGSERGGDATLRALRPRRRAACIPLVLAGRTTDVGHHPVRPRAPGLV